MADTTIAVVGHDNATDDGLMEQLIGYHWKMTNDGLMGLVR
jgi:hypothetical protein